MSRISVTAPHRHDSDLPSTAWLYRLSVSHSWPRSTHTAHCLSVLTEGRRSKRAG